MLLRVSNDYGKRLLRANDFQGTCGDNRTRNRITRSDSNNHNIDVKTHVCATWLTKKVSNIPLSSRFAVEVHPQLHKMLYNLCSLSEAKDKDGAVFTTSENKPQAAKRSLAEQLSLQGKKTKHV